MNDSNKLELPCGKPLLIYGNPGTGKTHLALELLKDTILLRIDVSQIKEIKDMKHYLLDKLKRRNVTLMFKDKNDQRGLLIDDIHIFQKYDKSCFRSLINFIHEGTYYKSKIIITCCKLFIKNKDLCKLKINMHEMKYTYSEYYKLCLKIVRQKKIKIHLDSCDSKVYSSDYNLNNFLSECSQKSTNLVKDKYDGIEVVTKKIIDNSYPLENIFRICEGDERIILLNLIENIETDHLNIYNFIDDFNRKDIFIHENKILNVPIKMINSTKQNVTKLVYNRYISKNMIKHKNMKNDYLLDKVIYLIDTYRVTKDDKYKDELLKIDSNIINYHIYAYECLYDTKSLYRSS